MVIKVHEFQRHNVTFPYKHVAMSGHTHPHCETQKWDDESHVQRLTSSRPTGHVLFNDPTLTGVED